MNSNVQLGNYFSTSTIVNVFHIFLNILQDHTILNIKKSMNIYLLTHMKGLVSNVQVELTYLKV